MTSDLSSLYKNRPILVWVEDSLTRAWLHHLWQDSDIGLLVAGGNDAVFGAVKDAHESGHANVFGFRDRDFIQSNQASWLDPARNPTVFVPEAHEVENFLLDFQGLAALGPGHNPHGRTAVALEQRAQDHAERSLWWMAVRATIADLRHQLTEGFPSHPKLKVEALASMQDAQAMLEARLLNSPWGVHLKQVVPGLDPAWIEDRLRHHEAALRLALDDGTWRWTWSGKELFAQVAGYLNQGGLVADLAKGLAAHQRQHDTTDPTMANLRSALRRRAGVDGW